MHGSQIDVGGYGVALPATEIRLIFSSEPHNTVVGSSPLDSPFIEVILPRPRSTLELRSHSLDRINAIQEGESSRPPVAPQPLAPSHGR